MGGNQSTIADDEIDMYLERTNLTRREIIQIHKRFMAIDRDGNGYLTQDEVCLIPEFAVNPFKERLCQVFSETKNGILTFDSFITMMSVFSENASVDEKVKFAFKIYDMDGDGRISYRDLYDMVECILGKETSMPPEFLHTIVTKIQKEADLDGSQDIGPSEFARVLQRVPDFASKFRMTL